jgi:peptide deformylase
MAILKIARMGHPVLHRRADEVADPAAPDLAALIDDMFETMVDADGLGLAAPQVHENKRVVIFRTPDAAAEGSDDAEWSGLTVLINPVVEPVDEAREDGWEGCLSLPGLRGLVPRYCRVRYGGTAPDGSVIDREVEGMHARVVQHECDHLDGILYPMRMTDLSKLIFESEFRHFHAAASDERECVA